jgi:hypothetical protein
LEQDFLIIFPLWLCFSHAIKDTLCEYFLDAPFVGDIDRLDLSQEASVEFCVRIYVSRHNDFFL